MRILVMMILIYTITVQEQSETVGKNASCKCISTKILPSLSSWAYLYNGSMVNDIFVHLTTKNKRFIAKSNLLQQCIIRLLKNKRKY